MCFAVIALAALVYDAAVAGDDLVLGWSGRADTLFFFFFAFIFNFFVLTKCCWPLPLHFLCTCSY